ANACSVRSSPVSMIRGIRTPSRSVPIPPSPPRGSRWAATDDFPTQRFGIEFLAHAAAAARPRDWDDGRESDPAPGDRCASTPDWGDGASEFLSRGDGTDPG